MGEDPGHEDTDFHDPILVEVPLGRRDDSFCQENGHIRGKNQHYPHKTSFEKVVL